MMQQWLIKCSRKTTKKDLQLKSSQINEISICTLLWLPLNDIK